MKGFFRVLFLLPILSACVPVYDSYYDETYPVPQVQVEEPYYRYHRYHRASPPRVHQHESNTVRHSPFYHSHDSEVINPIEPVPNSSNARVHGHD